MFNNNYSDSLFTEKANIDPGIKPIIKKLNKKGYKTKYSSSGHNNLIAKDDRTRNGVRDGRLYSDARVVFDGHYDLGKAPKYWYWKKIVGDDYYLDIREIRYVTTKGGPSKAFQDWKIKYMRSLENWVDSLPYNKSESVEESYDDMMEDLDSYFESEMDELFLDLLFD